MMADAFGISHHWQGEWPAAGFKKSELPFL